MVGCALRGLMRTRGPAAAPCGLLLDEFQNLARLGPVERDISWRPVRRAAGFFVRGLALLRAMYPHTWVLDEWRWAASVQCVEWPDDVGLPVLADGRGLRSSCTGRMGPGASAAGRCTAGIVAPGNPSLRRGLRLLTLRSTMPDGWIADLQLVFVRACDPVLGRRINYRSRSRGPRGARRIRMGDPELGPSSRSATGTALISCRCGSGWSAAANARTTRRRRDVKPLHPKWVRRRFRNADHRPAHPA